MQPEIDAQPSNFFEDAPARDFAKVMRGYDQHQVDEYLKQTDQEIRQHRDQAQALQQATIAAINAHRVPAALQKQLQSTATDLVQRIRCTPPTSSPAPESMGGSDNAKREKHKKHHGDGKHGGDGEGGGD